MSNYEQYSKEELISRIEELEKLLKLQDSNQPLNFSEFKRVHGSKILDNLPDMLSVFDRNYNYIALASSEETVHVGGSSDNLIGKNLLDILPPDAYKLVKENFDRVMDTGEPSIGFHNLYVDGELENFENRVIPLDNNKNLLCICRNITDQVKIQTQLQMVTSAVNNSVEEIYAVNTNGSFVFANKQFRNHHHITGELEKIKIYHIYQDQDENQWKAFVQELKDAGGAFNYTTNHINREGEKRALEISAFMLKDNIGQEIIWTIGRDITERIEQDNKIRELNQLMETILNNIPVYLFVKDTGDDFRYLYWNKEFERVSRIPASSVIGRTDAEIFPEKKDAQKFREDDLEILKNNRTVDFEEDYITAIGEKRIVHTIKTLVPLKGKQPLLIGFSWDITEQKHIEQELIKSRIKAEESDKLKSAFLANMSHEIRTPLNAIVGFSKLMAETENQDERMQYAEIVDKNTDLLLQLINDILDLSKIEAGMLEFKEKTASLNELCQGIYETFLPRMPQGVKLVYNKNPEDVITQTDGNRVAQVLTNLLNNAQKFTRSGEISFGYIKKENQIEFFVKDTGMGIAPENIGKIFNRFIKLNSFIQGTGLGLPICRMILENMGGEIHVQSTLNQGTEFVFMLPWKPAKLNQSSDVPTSHNSRVGNNKATILVAEDVESNFLLLETILGKTYHLLHAQNGREAVEMFQKEKPDLILMDLKMPEMDGIEATQLIRHQSQTIPIIALTAFAYEADKENALRAGCDDFLVKPVSISLLKKALEKYI